mmetsp:Transcript_1327/g.3253  ORF Transcript_1327/g.3253 Transcript_1327/m.3253 type:complete len:260 (+) Transcript_1327:138-917(+)
MADDDHWGALQEDAERLGERADEVEAPQGRLGFEEKFEGKHGDQDDGDIDPSSEHDGPVANPPVRKAAGWGDEAAPSEGKAGEDDQSEAAKKSKRKSAARDGFMMDIETTSPTDEKEASKNKHFAVDDDASGSIMVIPDLDEDQEEDLQLKVAEAPANVRTVQTLRELDRQIHGLQITNANLDDNQRLDLSILSRVLVPREKLEEPDEPWDFDKLLEHVSQEMTRQRESNEAFERSHAETASAGNTQVPTPIIATGSSP